MRSVSVRYPQLQSFVAAVFQACGVAREQSVIAANVLCYADLHGFDTHGVCNLERIYVPRLLDGRIDPRAEPQVVADSGAAAVIDGHDGLGLVVAVQAIDLAITKGRQFGIGAVSVRRSSHFGSAGYYTARALDANMIGIAMTNLGSQAIVRPPHGTINMLGTNPLSAAAPAGDLPPFVLDMSTTVVATGKVRAAQRQGRTIPAGWLVDDAGDPVTDPAALDRGTGHLLFLGGDPATGGYKGYGLALLVDILCGVLSGAGVGPHPSLLAGKTHPGDDLNIGHFFLAINIESFRPVADFRQHLDEMLGTLLGCPTSRAHQQVSYPGYHEMRSQQERGTQGIPLDDEVYLSLRRLAERFELQPLALAAADPQR